VRPTLFPVLRYDDAPTAIEFLVRAFGFEVAADFRAPDGSVVHADLRWGPSTIGVSSISTSPPDSPWAGVRQGLYIVVDDPDAYYHRAMAAGADIAMPIADQSYGSRDFGLRDPEGHLWGFGTYAMGRGSGAPTIFPEVLYRDAVSGIEWLEQAAGFRRGLVVPGDDGSIKHAEMWLDAGTLFVGHAPDDDQFRGLTHFASLHVTDPDAHFERARAAGARVVMEPQMTPFGARFYAARDPEGVLWWISTYAPAQ
jgi:uncharacterized glyoxalase superfamily protein PhnB